MSYTSSSVFRRGTAVSRVLEVIELLGFARVHDGLNVPHRVGSYFWRSAKEYQTYVGVELQVYRRGSAVTVDTRSRAGRSYWELNHQNKTLKLLRDLFGGHFTTDAGRNRYWRPDEPPPSPLSSSCYIARWVFNNALIRPRIYLDNRQFQGNIARERPAGFGPLDAMNPRLLSNNLIVPYLIAVWEEYFGATFAALLEREQAFEPVLRKARISTELLAATASGNIPLVRAISESLSFQRPSIIGQNFRLVYPLIDVAAALRRPYRRRRTSLYDAIEQIVEARNTLVHSGEIDLTLYDQELRSLISDIEAAADRVYVHIGDVYGFEPMRDY